MDNELIFRLQHRLDEALEAMKQQQLQIDRIAAQNTAMSAVFQTLAVVIHQKTDVKRDELAVALEGAARWLEQIAQPEAAQYSRVLQRALLLRIPDHDDPGQSPN